MNSLSIRNVYPIKYYSKEGFVERKLEINEEDMKGIIEDYLRRNTEFDFDEIEIINNRPMNIWLYALCRTYIDPDDPDKEEALTDVEVEIIGDYDRNEILIVPIPPKGWARMNVPERNYYTVNHGNPLNSIF